MDPADSIAVMAADAVAACQRAWPEVQVSHARVAERLDALRAAAAIDRGHLGDLCLAWACLDGDPAAQRTVDRMIRGEAQRAIRELRQDDWLIDEVHQELNRRLLVAETGAPPRLASYAGHSVLGRWLGVAATRTALNLIQRARPAVELDDDLAAALPGAGEAPELRLLRDRYRGELELAIKASFAALDGARDRNLLRLYYLDGIGLDRLALMFRVHPSTVSRWLASLREQIFEDTRTRLAERLGIGGDEFDSLVRVLRSDLDVTLSRILERSR